VNLRRGGYDKSGETLTRWDLVITTDANKSWVLVG